MDFKQQFKAAARVSTPLVGVHTFDAKSTTDGIKEMAVCDHHYLWDACNGLALADSKTDSRNVLQDAMQKAGIQEQAATIVLPEALRVIASMQESCLVFLSNAHLFWADAPEVIQGIWNLRDILKGNGSMLVLMIAPGIDLPLELQNDVMLLDEPLPTVPELEKIVLQSYAAGRKQNKKLQEPDAALMVKATDALKGLPAFPADQSTAMCLDVESGKLDLPELWGRKKTIVSQKQGLTFCSRTTKYADIGGAANCKKFFTGYMKGKAAPTVILRMDEVEKLFAGSGTDTSGSKTGLTGGFLKWTAEKKIAMAAFVGIPGSGKTEFIYALGNEYETPVIDFDIDAMQDKYIGNTGANFRAATATIDAIADNVLIIATSNGLGSLPPEIRSRMKLGIFFWDAPDADAQKQIWAIWRKKCGIAETDSVDFDTTGWTGREIEECCNKADVLGISLKDASKFVVPVMKSAAAEMQALRDSASGKYISADYEGVYQYSEIQLQATPKTRDRVLKG